jgi:hypothetical protein
MTATVIKFNTRNIAEYTAFLLRSMLTAVIIAIAANTMNKIRSCVIEASEFMYFANK